MRVKKIDFASRYLAITYIGQHTIIKTRNNTYEGFLNSILPVQENGVQTNKWKFVLFQDTKEILINENEVESISLVENGNLVYHLNDTMEYNRLYQSSRPEMVQRYNFFNR